MSKKAAAKQAKTGKEVTGDAVREANEAFERRRGEGLVVSIRDVEAEFGLRPNQLVNYRKNQSKLERAARAAVAEMGAGEPDGARLMGAGSAVATWPGMRDLEPGTGGSDLVIDGEVRLIPLDETEADPANFRTRMDKEKFDELVAGVRKYGVRQNCEAFWCEESRRWRINAGNRRQAASLAAREQLRNELRCREAGFAVDFPETADELRLMLARVEKLPCRIISAEDAGRVKMLQLIENLSREDLDELDEARGYDYLIGVCGFTPARVARETGKSVDLVRQRRQLLRCPDFFQEAMRLGIVGFRRGVMVASVPSPIDREIFARMILEPKWRDTPLSDEEAAKLLREEFKITLAGAPFSVEEEGLVDGVGSCMGCGFRTGKMVENEAAEGLLDGAVVGGGAQRLGSSGFSPMVCTKPSCYRVKVAAHQAREAAKAEAAGKRVLAESELGDLFQAQGGRSGLDAALIRLDEKPGVREMGHYDLDKVRTWEEYLAEAGVEITADLLAPSPEGTLVRVMDREAAVRAIVEGCERLGRKNPFEHGKGPGEARREAQRQERETKKGSEKRGIALLGDVMTAIFDEGDEKLGGLLLLLVAHVVEGSEDAQVALKRVLGLSGRLGESATEAIVGFIEGMERSPRQLMAYLTGALLSDEARWEADKQVTTLRAVAEYYGVKVGRGSKGEPAGKAGKGGFNLDVTEEGERGPDGWHVINEHGVFHRPDRVRIFNRKDKRHDLTICLAESEAGWYAAHQYARCNEGGGGLPSRDYPGSVAYGTVSEALLQELLRARKHFVPSGNPMVKDAPGWVNEVIDEAIRALGGDPPAQLAEPEEAGKGDGAILEVGMLKVGGVVRTSYGTGPYVIESIQLLGEDVAREAFGVVESGLNCFSMVVRNFHAMLGRKEKPFYLNCYDSTGRCRLAGSNDRLFFFDDEKWADGEGCGLPDAPAAEPEAAVSDPDAEPGAFDEACGGWVDVEVWEPQEKAMPRFSAHFPVVAGVCRDDLAKEWGNAREEAVSRLIEGHFGVRPSLMAHYRETKKGKLYRCLVEPAELSREGGEEE